MFYEHIANLKSRFDAFRFRNQVFTPAGTTPVSAPSEEKPSLLETLKSFNLKSLSFETKRLIVLGAVLISSLVIIAGLNSNFASYQASRRASSSNNNPVGDPNAWEKFVSRKRNSVESTPIDSEPNDATTFQESMLQ